ncbi:hypothetical protein ACJ41O_008404 [Fusarium nematophilum]
MIPLPPVFLLRPWTVTIVKLYMAFAIAVAIASDLSSASSNSTLVGSILGARQVTFPALVSWFVALLGLMDLIDVTVRLWTYVGAYVTKLLLFGACLAALYRVCGY